MRLKLNPLRDNIKGKRLVVVDDSIVRGTTTRQTIALLREAGATEVHFRVSSPPYRWPCFYGLDTGKRSDLLAADMAVGEIRDYLGVDSLAYLDLDRLVAATGSPARGVLHARASPASTRCPCPTTTPSTRSSRRAHDARLGHRRRVSRRDATVRTQRQPGSSAGGEP